jgi:hypothetical protein
LDYWARRHVTAAGQGGGGDALRLFSGRSLPPDREEALLEAVNTVFDNFEEQFSLSLRIAQSNYLGAPETGGEHASESRLRSGVGRSGGRFATGTDE